MDYAKVKLALDYLQANSGLVLPYGYVPGATWGGEIPITSEAEWNAYQWNPPQHLVARAEIRNGERVAVPMLTEADPDASPKPTWAAIVAAADAARPVQLRLDRREELTEECRGRITAAYGETSLQDEILLRLRDGNTPAQDTERDRLRARYATLRDSLATMTAAQLETFDPTDDAHWRADDAD